MSVAKTHTYTLTAPDADGICEAQQTAGAANLDIDGALASDGAFTVDDKCAKRIGIFCAGDISSVTFTVTGKLTEFGADVTEDATGVNNSTVETTSYFYSVSQVAASAAVGTDVIVGTVDEAATPEIILDTKSEATSVSVGLSGTINVDLQHTLQNLQELYRTETHTESEAAWLDNDAETPLTGLTTGQTATAYQVPIYALRVVTNSYSSTPTIKVRVVQQAPHG